MKKEFFMVAILLITSVCLPLNSAIDSTERAAVIAFYNSTDGDNWLDNTGWKEGDLEADGFALNGSESGWFGVTVLDHHVTELVFPANGLNGTIPTRLGDLTYLKKLWLEAIDLTDLPAELANLTQLEELSLALNDLAALPSVVAQLTTLKRLDLSNNKLESLTGIGKLVNLEVLEIWSNHLESLPAEFGKLTKLTELDVTANFYMSRLPVGFSNLVNLETLRLFNLNLTALPDNFANLDKLKHLWLDMNELSSSSVHMLGQLVNLETLSLSSNPFTYFPTGLGTLVNLKTLTMNLCESITSPIPADICNLTKLETLSLYLNNLSGSIPSALGKLVNLVSLDLSSNQLSGPIPAELGNLSSLEMLNLSFNRLRSTIPSQLGNLTALKTMLLYQNQLSGILPAELGNLSNLETLYLNNNQFSGMLPREMGHMANLQFFDLDNNHITGLPDTSGNLHALKVLSIQNNLLTILPAAIGNLPELSVLKLRDNQITHLPPFGKLPRLEYIILSGNQLLTLPPSLADIKSLQSLSLSNNQFTTIPSVIFKMTFLKVLDLSCNRLSGEIPQAIESLTNLFTLNLAANALSGAVPKGITKLTALASEHAWNYYYLSLGYNSLYTDDQEVEQFLKSKDWSWAFNQNIPPSGFSTEPDFNSVMLSWMPINYTDHNGYYRIFYRTDPSASWTYVGQTLDKTAHSFRVGNLWQGTTYYFAVDTITKAHDGNPNELVSRKSPETIMATTYANPPGNDQLPFGHIGLPDTGASPVSGAIAVAGWALDDVGVESVKIFLLQGPNKIYIGDALFVEGARPDVEAQYVGYPNAGRAGWGYMLLTHFLPNGGNGTYTLTAIASDILNQETVLGTRSFVCDNANAVKPFGTIDSPAQGGNASGNSFRNLGWVLAAMGNKIPEDGSTLKVFIDGVYIGKPTYNIYRNDIAILFPGYANSSGAHAYLDFDTTGLSNGVHTIQWTATDEAGHTDGIGSRYFTVQNQAADLQVREKHISPDFLNTMPIDHVSPATVCKGLNNHNSAPVYPGQDGSMTIQIQPMERLEIDLSGREYAGFIYDVRSVYSVVNGQFRPPPAGSHLDRQSGKFYWQPGAPFLAGYVLAFFMEDISGNKHIKYIRVNISSACPSGGKLL